MSKKIICIVTGRSMLIADSYYQSKVDKAGSEEILAKTYICTAAKKLLKLGNSVKKVREILNSDCTITIDDQLISDLIFRSKKRMTDSSSDFKMLTSVTHNETDRDIQIFIDKIK